MRAPTQTGRERTLAQESRKHPHTWGGSTQTCKERTHAFVEREDSHMRGGKELGIDLWSFG